MKIMIAGLGLIGGSMAKALKKAGISTDGFDREEVLSYALQQGIIASFAQDISDYDVVFVALPPEATLSFIEENEFKQGAVVADICGVKGVIERAVMSKPRNFRYVGCHPMAGKEVSGIRNSEADLFKKASMIVVENEYTDSEAEKVIVGLSRKMGFARIVRCSSSYHDAKIAYTSQLAHIVSNAYVKSPTAQGYSGFTGGSFQDMTRIAGVDEKLWAKLFILNRDQITQELSRLIGNLQKYQNALNKGEEEPLEALLREGRLQKERLDIEKDKKK